MRVPVLVLVTTDVLCNAAAGYMDVEADKPSPSAHVTTVSAHSLTRSIA